MSTSFVYVIDYPQDDGAAAYMHLVRTAVALGYKLAQIAPWRRGITDGDLPLSEGSPLVKALRKDGWKFHA